MNAKIYRRANGQFGSSCDGCADTGHRIVSNGDDTFTVWSIHDEEMVIADRLSRADAEFEIAADWREAIA